MANKSKDKKYHFLYRTTNLLNKKVYYGIHSTNNLDDGYLGSGSYLYRSVKKYGKENFKREILEFFHNREDLVQAEEKLITEEFVKDPMCHNIVTGGEGWNSINTVVVRDKEGRCYRVHKDDPRYLSGELVHVTKGQVTAKDKDGNFLKIHKDDPRYLSGELVGVTKGQVTLKDKNGNYYNVDINDPRYLSGELVGVTKGQVTLKDKNGNYYNVDINDPKYLSGDLKHLSSGKVTVKDKDGNCYSVSTNDPRYLSGELKPSRTGKKHTDETKRKMSETKRKNKSHSGERNSQYGTMWITNGIENKKIKKDIKIPEGWSKGRKIFNK